jgi:hypothetical protein
LNERSRPSIALWFQVERQWLIRIVEPVAARNAGAQVAQGDLVIFVDASRRTCETCAGNGAGSLLFDVGRLGRRRA